MELRKAAGDTRNTSLCLEPHRRERSRGQRRHLRRPIHWDGASAFSAEPEAVFHDTPLPCGSYHWYRKKARISDFRPASQFKLGLYESLHHPMPDLRSHSPISVFLATYVSVDKLSGRGPSHDLAPGRRHEGICPGV